MFLYIKTMIHDEGVYRLHTIDHFCIARSTHSSFTSFFGPEITRKTTLTWSSLAKLKGIPKNGVQNCDFELSSILTYYICYYVPLEVNPFFFFPLEKIFTKVCRNQISSPPLPQVSSQALKRCCERFGPCQRHQYNCNVGSNWYLVKLDTDKTHAA